MLTGNLLKDPDFTMEFHRGELFHDAVNERDSAALNSLRHPPVVLDATLDAVIRTLERSRKIRSGARQCLRKRKKSPATPLHLALPATSANLGPAFDAAALAMDFYITIDARPAADFSIAPPAAIWKSAGL